MPVFIDKTDSDETRLVIWKVTESLDFFKENLNLGFEETKFLSSLNSKREKEWMASRFLIQDICEIDMKTQLRKDQYGKPYLVQKDVHISISHSHEYSVLVISPLIVGVDIQLELNKITRIGPKFVNEEERAFINSMNEVDYLHTIWGAKESMYKAYGRKSVDFKIDMMVESFEYDDQGFEFKGHLTKEKIYNYDLQAEKIDNYYLLLAKQSN